MKKQDLLKGSVILMLSAAAAKVLGAVFKLPLTNMLGGVGMSCFSCAYTIFMPVYAVTASGISSAAARMTARYAALGLYGDALRVRRMALAVFSAAGLAGSGLILMLAVPFSRWSCGSNEAAPAIMMIAPAVLLGCVTAAERGYYEGMSNMYPTAFSQTAEGIVRAGAGLALCGYTVSHGRELLEVLPWVSDVRSVAAAAGILGVTLGSAGGVLFFAVLRLLPSCVPECSGGLHASRRETASELVLTSLPTGLSALVTNLTGIVDMCTIIGSVTVPVLSALPAGVSPEDYPRFVYGSFAGIALTVFNLVPGITNMLGKGALPAVTGAWTSGDRKALEESTSQALVTAALIAVPCAAGLGVLSGQVLTLLFPGRAAEAELCVNALRLLMPGMLCLCLSFPLFSMLQAVGKPFAPLWIMLAGTAVKLCGNLLLVPSMGADGAAVSTSVCYAVILSLAVYIYLSCTGVRLRIRELGAVLYSGAVCAGSAWLAADISCRSGAGIILQILLSAFIGGTVYIAALWLSVGKRLIKTTGSRKAAC